MANTRVIRDDVIEQKDGGKFRYVNTHVGSFFHLFIWKDAKTISEKWNSSVLIQQKT